MSPATWDWPAITADLDASGCAVTPRLLTPAQCRDLAGLYDRPELFRSTIDMARHRFGSGQYRYFTHDLPEPVRALRGALYPHLLTTARSWAGQLGRPGPRAAGAPPPPPPPPPPERGHQPRPARPVAGHPGRVARAVPPGRPVQ